MPFIQNVSAFDTTQGRYTKTRGAILIRIGDYIEPYFPPLLLNEHNFTEIHTFCFDDIEETSEQSIKDSTAIAIATLLKKALDEDADVIVHCFAGLCRSGAVVECGVILGFEDTGVKRMPNILVKNKILKALGFELYNHEEDV